MGKYESVLLVSFMGTFFPAFALYHLMTFRVNRNLPPGGKIPHTLTARWSSRLSAAYKRLYPRSRLYQLTMALVVAGLTIALLFVALRVWEQVNGN